MSAKEDGLMMAGIIGGAILFFLGVLAVAVVLPVAVARLPHVAYITASAMLFVVVVAVFSVFLYRCLPVELAFLLHTPFTTALIGLAVTKFRPEWATRLTTWGLWWLGADVVLILILFIRAKVRKGAKVR